MTNNDDFTEAARAYAEEWNRHAEESFNLGEEGAHGVDEESLIAGAEWARAYLDARAETEALVDDIIHWDDTTATDGPCDGTWDSLAAHLIRRGWTRTTRRDKETDR